MSKRVLVTGASGLLGRAVTQTFRTDGSWEVTGLAFSRATDGLRKVDLNNPQAVKDVFQEIKPTVVIHCAAEKRPDVVEHKTEEAWKLNVSVVPTVVIHCAAEKRPDVVEHQTEEAWKLNVSATETLCREAAACGAWLLYISTDYVFDGKNPPYSVDASPNPLNKYGRSKLGGENSTLQACKEFAILRLPILYGSVQRVDESAITVLFPKVKVTDQSCVMSDFERRFPTHCDDVAKVIQQMAERRIKDSSMSGIFHWSGNEEMTKYDMAVAMATIFDLPTSHIQGQKFASGDAIRPYNTQLDCSRLESLGIGQRSAFRDGIKSVLQPFL